MQVGGACFFHYRGKRDIGKLAVVAIFAADVAVLDSRVEWVVAYSRFPEFYIPMCKPCHKERDIERRLAERRLFRDWLQSQRQSPNDPGSPPF